MDVSTTDLGVVFIHGLFSSEKTWDPLARLLESDEELASVTVRRYSYASPKLRRFRPDRRTPDYSDLADGLKTFLHYEAAGHDRLILVAHSQGGLIVQRYLARMINSGQGQQLTKIRGVMLFACPNEGSDFMLPLRRAWWRTNPQVRALVPLNPDMKDAQRTVFEQIVHAQEVGPSSCPIPFWVFGGEEDNVVVRASAQSVFPRPFMLPGDHFSIITPQTHSDRAYVALRTHLLEVQQKTDPATPGAAASNPSPPAAQATPWGDSAKAARILDVLPPYADWLKTLRTQDFFVVSGRVNRLFHDAADALRTDPLQFIDPALRDAAATCNSAATDLSEAMIDLLFADRIDAKAYEDLPAPEKEDAWTLFLGEHERGESELRLQTLRNAFFETYDALVRLLNERLLAPKETTSPPRGSTPTTADAPPAVPAAADRQPRVGQGLPMYERELRVAYDQLRSVGIGAPVSDAYLSGATVVQHFAASEERGSGWVLSLRNSRAVAVSEPLWNALVRAGRPAADGEPLNAVGYPTAPGSEPAVLGPDVQRVALEGGNWGRGWLIRGDHDWRWEPQADLGFNQTRSATNWTAAQPAPQLRLRAVITLPWDTAEELEVTPERRRDLKAKLPISRLAGAVTTLSLRRGADLRAANWEPGPNRNAIDSVSYSATIVAPDGRPALTGAVMASLPGTLQPSTVTCAEVALQDTAAWTAALPPDASTKLTLEEMASVLLAAWETAADVLPAAACDVTAMRWAGPPTVELRVSAEGPHDQPRANLDTLINLSEAGATDRSSLPEMAVTITVSPMLADTERRQVLRRALVRMLQGFGYVEADEDLLA